MFDRFLLLVDPLIVACLAAFLIVIAGIIAYSRRASGISRKCENCGLFSDSLDMVMVKNPDPEGRPQFLLLCRACRDDLKELSES